MNSRVRKAATRCAELARETSDRVLDAIDPVLDVAVRRRMRLRWQVVTVLVALILSGLASRAQADTVNASHVHYNAGSGAVEATVTAVGPLDTGIALALARGRCPAAPEESEVQPGVTADGQPHHLLADAPSRHAAAGMVLCVWTIHTDGTIGALYETPRASRANARHKAKGHARRHNHQPALSGSTE
jgi:hypothetical protein